MDKIKIINAKVHNLRNVSVTIPRNSLTIITGPSGSGKSSLAFDTLYAEGQRRYIESLSSYAKQFIGQMEAPDVESISGLSPTIAIDQKSTSKNPRSTVGTITEIYDYLRLLYAKLGTAHCPETGERVSKQTPQQIVDEILKFKEGTKLQILSPVIRSKKGEHKEELSKFLSLGYSKVRINKEFFSLDESLRLNKSKFNDIDIIIDRIVLKNGISNRLIESVEQALKFSEGYLIVIGNEKEYFFSEKNYSYKLNKSFPDLEPRMFSFNSPLGACPACNGLGISRKFEKENLLIDQSLSLYEGAIPIILKNPLLLEMIKYIAKEEGIILDKPISELDEEFISLIFYGSKKIYEFKFNFENSRWNFKKEFSGIISWLSKKYDETDSDKIKSELEELMITTKCKSCHGKKLNPFSLSVTLKNKSIMDVCDLPIDESLEFISSLKFSGNQKLIADKVLKEITDRLKFLINVGLNYLTLNRDSGSLSGGESQRIRLATQIGSALSGVLYILDEPSIGLHQRDNQKLINTLVDLKNIGNTVIVVEHDEDTMLASDFIIDMGPKAGIHGGEIVATGTPDEIKSNLKSITGQYLKKSLQIYPSEQKRISEKYILLKNAKENNLKDINLKIPLGILTCVTGVSGSGKSTLIHKVLVPAIKSVLSGKKNITHTNFKSISGIENLKSLIELDQSPIGRTPHSNPATYTGLFDQIRNVFSQTNESKLKGFRPGRFSFNLKGGRCESCEGNGSIKFEMHFLPDVYVTCTECQGSRYNKETLSILYRGKNISEVLNMTIEEAFVFFENYPRINRTLKVLNEVGLGYIKLGQPATTLSGGEAQRLKLSRELAKAIKGSTLYVLDEPTTGLHFEDIKILLKALNKLVEKGHTLLIIEHNLDVIKTADWVIDLGPDGGVKGGEIVAEGTPAEIVKNKKSITGKFLSRFFEK